MEIAIKCHADGIHVGQEDMEAAQVRQRVGDDMIIGVSVHSVEEALEAVKSGADCLGVGAMFSTSTKTDVNVLPKETLATSGSSLMKNDAVQTLIEELLPVSTLVTPNIPEAQILSGLTIESKEDMIAAAKHIGDSYSCAVLLKGGHSINDANDLLYANGELIWFEGKRIHNPNTHGTGCTLSSAIASNLAKGFTLAESVRRAKDYISGALAAMLDLGEGSGPMQHNFDLQGEYAKEATK